MFNIDLNVNNSVRENLIQDDVFKETNEKKTTLKTKTSWNVMHVFVL